MPTQNPDGRARNIRRKAHAFDLNRDWLTRTQPETDGKLQLIRRYPPLLEFRRNDRKFHHGPPYDFFASIFGDTVPAVGFHAAGMTFEKDYRDPLRDRVLEHYSAMWASVFQGASGGSSYVREWHESDVDAYGSVTSPKITVRSRRPAAHGMGIY